MKERVQVTRKKNNGGRGSGWKPEYSSEGSMRFGVKGYVQIVKQGKTKNGNCDFVTFLIDNPFVSIYCQKFLFCREIPLLAQIGTPSKWWIHTTPIINIVDH